MTRKPLRIAISSQALFDLHESNTVFEEHGLEQYRRFQIEKEDEPLAPGEGFAFVKKLTNINKLDKERRVDVILLSRNSTDTGLRIINSVKHHGLDVTKAAFCNGNSPYRYIEPFDCDLFLSMDSNDVRHALESNVAAANLLPGPVGSGRGPNGVNGSVSVHEDPEQLRVAFDGDAVLFSDEAERIFQAEGLNAFASAEEKNATSPLPGGPFKSFLQALYDLQQEFKNDCPIRTALVTARSAPAHERVIRTLRVWNIRLDEALFIGGMNKSKFLQAFGADVFFDDQRKHCEDAAAHTPVGHVPAGITNER